MKKNTQLIGTGVALITPFTEQGKVDEKSLAMLVDDVIEQGVDYLVVLGTTAETATLSKLEKEIVKKTIKEVNNQRVPMVLAIGGNSTEDVVKEVKSTQLTDYQAILSVSPYYNKPSQQGIYQHFKQIAQSTEYPILLYNVPGRTAVNISVQTTIQLAKDFSNIIGIKEASGNITQIMQIISQKPDDFLVISGDDITTLPSILMGGDGVISVIAQGLPKDFSQMVRSGLSGQITQANALHYKMMESFNLIFEEGNPTGIKTLLQIKGMCLNKVRLPLVPASEKLTNDIECFLRNKGYL